MLPHRTYIEILFRIVEHITRQKGIVLLFPYTFAREIKREESKMFLFEVSK